MMNSLWFAFIGLILVQSVTSNFVLTYKKGPFNRKRLDKFHLDGKETTVVGSAFCIDGNDIGPCGGSLELQDKTFGVIPFLQVDAFDPDIPAHRGSDLLRWRPVNNKGRNDTISAAMVFGSPDCSVHIPRLGHNRKSHVNIMCGTEQQGIRVYLKTKSYFEDSRSVNIQTLFIPVYTLKTDDTITAITFVCTAHDVLKLANDPVLTTEKLQRDYDGKLLNIFISDNRIPSSYLGATDKKPTVTIWNDRGDYDERAVGRITFFCGTLYRDRENYSSRCIRHYDLSNKIYTTPFKGSTEVHVGEIWPKQLQPVLDYSLVIVSSPNE